MKEIAEAIDKKLHGLLKQEKPPAPFSIKQARLYGVNVKSDCELASLCLIGENPDIYDLMSEVHHARTAKLFHYFFFVTTGWAAPIGDNGEPSDERPSEHPQRRRVRLLLVGSESGEVITVLRFGDNPEEMEIQDENGKGELMNSLLAFASLVSEKGAS